MLKQWIRTFWDWYERYYQWNLIITTALFALQIVHLYWLGSHVIALRLLGKSYFALTPFWQFVIVIIDYTEIPALLSTSLLYLHNLTQRKVWKRSYVFLILLNSQWLHLFWITDEFVITALTGGRTGSVLPPWLAWTAIGIDYLEIPVIIDMIIRTTRSLAQHRFVRFLKKEARYHIWHI